MDLILIHLKGFGCSGRAVKMAPISPDAVDSLRDEAAKAVGMDGSMVAYQNQIWKLGAMQMIKQVSTGSVDDPLASEVKWKKVKGSDIDEGSFFTAKDWTFLKAVYRQHHEVTEAEIDAIVGKALTVSED